MLSRNARARLRVVLVGARNPQNIGAAARAMQDFGFSDLHVVNDFTPPFEAAQLEASSAVGAASVMSRAVLSSDLGTALADCTVVAGTTAVGGRMPRIPLQTLQDAAPALRSALATPGEDDSQPNENTVTRVALLFGSEKTGLTNEQLSYCNLLLTIPMFAPEGRHLSMNLGQSVAVCLYELVREGFADSRELQKHSAVPATVEDRERLVTSLLGVMQATGYARRFPANAREIVVRGLALQLGASRDEAATWLGFLHQMLRATEDRERHD